MDFLYIAGSFDNTAHMAALLDRTTNRGLRHCLLRLVEALLIPRSANISDQASLAARANATAFVEAGGVMLAVDLVAGGISLLTALPYTFISVRGQCFGGLRIQKSCAHGCGSL